MKLQPWHQHNPDGPCIHADTKQLCTSSHFFYRLNDLSQDDEVVDLLCVNAKIMSLLLSWLQKTTLELRCEFARLDTTTLIEVINACEYLEMEIIFEEACAYVASELQRYTSVSEMQQRFSNTQPLSLFKDKCNHKDGHDQRQ